jgi:hypothetical protein
MVEPLPLVVHERMGTWARQLRPRAGVWGFRLIESRSSNDLASAVHASSCPICIIELGDRPRASLGDLASAMNIAPAALALVLDAGNFPGASILARELGATHVMSGNILPPAVLNLVARWIPLARRRADSHGWSNAQLSAAAEPWGDLLPPGPKQSTGP